MLYCLGFIEVFFSILKAIILCTCTNRMAAGQYLPSDRERLVIGQVV